MRISIIAAIDEKRGLGKDDDLLFKIKEDFKRMQQLTIGHPIIMGRKTFESKPLRRVLPKRTNIIVTRDKSYSVEGAMTVSSLEEGIAVGRRVEHERLSSPTRSGIQDASLHEDSRFRGNDKDGEVFIFGGGQIFKEAIDKGLVDRLYLTIVKGDYGADTFFPEYKQFTIVVEREERKEDKYQYTFLTLEK